MTLSHLEDDGDAGMEIVVEDEEFSEENKTAVHQLELPFSQSIEEAQSNIPKVTCSTEHGYEDIDVDMEDEAFEPVEKDIGNIISQELSHRKTETAFDHGSCGWLDKVTTLPDNLPNEVLPVKSPGPFPSMLLSSGTENTPEKPINHSKEDVTSNPSIVSADVSPLLKFPTPSVSPKLNSSRKSLRTSSTSSASQSIPTCSNFEPVHASFAKPSNSFCLKSLTNRQNCFAMNEHLAATLQRGIEIIESQCLSSAL